MVKDDIGLIIKKTTKTIQEEVLEELGHDQVLKYIDRWQLQYLYDYYLNIKTGFPKEPANVAILHGSGNVGQIAECGAQLYQDYHARKLIVLGGMNRDTFIEEAITIKDALMNLKVARNDIWLDSESRDTKENAKAASHLIEMRIGKEKIMKIIVVAASFHARRAVMTDKRWIADGAESFEYYLHTYEPRGIVDDSGNLTNRGLNVTLKEYWSILKYRLREDIAEVRKHGYAYK